MNWMYLKEVFGKIFSFFDHVILKAIAAVWFYLAGIHVYLIAVAVLLFLDVITGIYASLKRGEPFTSKILKKGFLEKTALYLILMGASFAMEMVLKSIFGWESFFVVFLVTILITTYEFVSICENIYHINPQLTYLRSLIGLSNKVRDKAIKIAEEKVDNVTIKVETKVEVSVPDEKKEDEKN